MSSSKLSWISALTRFRSSLIGACLSALGLFALMGQLPLIDALAETKRRRCGTLQRRGRQFCDRAPLSGPVRLLEPDSKAYARARRLRANWMAARVTKAVRVSARFS